MTETFMANFNKTGVETNVLSESNSVTYSFELNGATNFSVAPSLKRNGVDIKQTFADGINVREFNSVTDMGSVKSFKLTSSSSSMNNSFIEYMKMSTAKIIILFSGKNLKSHSVVDEFFDSISSVNWAKSYLTDRFSCGYVGIYSTALKRIVAEVMTSTDGNSNTETAKLTTVVDDLSDFGILGSSKRIIETPQEYFSTNGYEYARFPTSATSVLMSDYNLISGNAVYLSTDIFQTQEMLNAGMKTRISIRWMDSAQTILKNDVLESSKVNWSSNEIYSVAPLNASRFTVVVSRYPRDDSLSSKSAIRNLSMSVSPKDGNGKNDGAMMSVYGGVKAGKIIEVDKTDQNLMSLPLDTSLLQNKEGDGT